MATIVSPVKQGYNAQYAPRPVRFIRMERAGDWRLKVYGIAMPCQAPRRELVEESIWKATEVLPKDAHADGREGVGFVTVHDAATCGITLIYWWQGTNELHQRISLSPLDDPTAMTQLEPQAAGCVWELEVVDFERRAWLEDVLKNPTGPDIDAYLSRRHNADV